MCFSFDISETTRTPSGAIPICDGFCRRAEEKRLVWLFAINRTTIPRIYNCSELVCAIVDLGIVGLSVMCAYYWHNLFIYLCKN